MPKPRLFVAFTLASVAWTTGLSWSASADDPAAANANAPTANAPIANAVDYSKQVKPLLAQRCVTCHGPLKQEGGLRLDAAALMKKGGDSGTALVPKDVAKSPLIDAVAGRNGFDGGRRMPKDAAPLTAEEIALLTRWIEQGAPSPADEKVAATPADHWAYQAPKRPAVPVVKNVAWVRNPIDAFLAADHEKHGLVPAREAPKHVLLRRLHLDLVGLPPSPEELKAFLADNSPDAYPKAVDRLLDSPHYGERWGRHWMDVWRYSDWYGYGAELRNSSRHIWRWRDWIVDSLNQDKPYDRMIVEMLAADELDPGNTDALRATGFLTRQYFKFNRNIWLENTIEHTSKAFLGVTMNCARCHEHKYDPISQNAFYQFRAIFEPYQVRTDRLSNANLETEGLDLAYDATLKTETFIFDRGNEATPLKDKLMEPAVPAALGKATFIVKPVDLPPTQWYPALRPDVQKALLAEVEAKRATAVASKGTAEATLAAARADLAAVRKRLEGVVAIAEIPGVDPQSATSESASKDGAAKPGDDPGKSPKPAPFLSENFAAANDKVWLRKAGQWEYANGRLLQKDPAGAFLSIETVAVAPRDVTIELKYRTTGGGQYKSVGVSFDQSADNTFDAVYTSVGGGKIQVMTSRGGSMSYPTDGAKPFVGEVGKDVTLRLDLRDTLLNVTLDGQFVLAYRLPERREGKLALWTYDATAEFRAFHVERLSSLVKLVEPTASPMSPGTSPGGAAKPQELTLAAAEAAANDADLSLRLATKRIEQATLARDSVVARIAADNAKYAAPPAGTPAATATPSPAAMSLAQAAVKIQRDDAVATAEVNVLQAELDQAKALRAAADAPADAAKKKAAEDAPKKLDAAKQALAAAVAARDKPLDGNYAPLGPVYPQQSTGRRLALARWIADRSNPLTARVAVNHLWMRHFGQPLVPTVFDFGLNGKPPTHPELLDWLACELMEGRGSRVEGQGTEARSGDKAAGDSASSPAPHAVPVAKTSSTSLAGSQQSTNSPPTSPAWRMKHLHRLMVLSSAYRMDSAESPAPASPSTLNPNPSTASVARPSTLDPRPDADNRHYTRMNSRRMEAEIVRDALLSVVGNLDRARGGPELAETAGLTTYRRSLYYRHAPEKFMTFLEVFDAANTTECYRRIETVIPQQALALVNSQLAIEQARRFTAKLTSETKDNETKSNAAPQPGATNIVAGATDTVFIARAFETILCRPPTDDERAACEKFLAAQSTRLADAKTLTPFSTGTPLTVKAATDPKQRARENLVHVLFNHTEFVTIR